MPTHIEGVPSDPAVQPASPTPDTAEAALLGLRVGPRVLIVDGHGARRSALRGELARTLPEGTTFLEAATVPEAFERARGSRMVVVGGSVVGASASSLVRLLGRLYPELHVVDLEQARGGDRRAQGTHGPPGTRWGGPPLATP